MGRIQLRRFKACFAALSIVVVTTTVGMAALTNVPAGAATKDTTPIVVGGDGDLSISAGVTQGFDAGIYRFNKAGGLDGRKIQYLGFQDDAFNPATNLSNAQELVNSKHVFAIAPFVGAVRRCGHRHLPEREQDPVPGLVDQRRLRHRSPSGASASTATRATPPCRAPAECSSCSPPKVTPRPRPR